MVVIFPIACRLCLTPLYFLGSPLPLQFHRRVLTGALPIVLRRLNLLLDILKPCNHPVECGALAGCDVFCPRCLDGRLNVGKENRWFVMTANKQLDEGFRCHHLPFKGSDFFVVRRKALLKLTRGHAFLLGW